jgi:hypothetical protein
MEVTSKQETVFGTRLEKFIQDAIQVPDRKSILERKYSAELAMFYIGRGNLDRARFYAALAVNNFLNAWSTLHPLLVASRQSLLQVLTRQLVCQSRIILFRV